MSSSGNILACKPVELTDRQEIELFFDGGCPLCKREISLLKRLDKSGKIKFVDISSESFQPASYGMTFDMFMKEINARLGDGTWIKGVEVFRKLYEAVGFKLLVKVSRFPLISHLLDFGYKVFAKNRLRFTGRCEAEGGSCNILRKNPSS